MEKRSILSLTIQYSFNRSLFRTKSVTVRAVLILSHLIVIKDGRSTFWQGTISNPEDSARSVRHQRYTNGINGRFSCSESTIETSIPPKFQATRRKSVRTFGAMNQRCLRCNCQSREQKDVTMLRGGRYLSKDIPAPYSPPPSW